MDRTEVREVAVEVELLCHHSEPSLLHTGGRLMQNEIQDHQ